MLHLIAFVALAVSSPGPFWGQLGHRVVARVAEAHLTEEARRGVRTLLDGDGMADVASWADEVRAQRPATAPWHYVNIPLTETEYDAARYCAGGQCIVAAIERCQAVLANRSAPRKERADALRFVIHLVGDLHQPLHASDRADRGGNDYQVQFGGQGSNLHRVWDSGLLEAMGASENSLTARLLRRSVLGLSGGTVADWAMESHARARDHAYGDLPSGRTLDETYTASQASIVEDGLLAGGIRLARLLNEAFGEKP